MDPSDPLNPKISCKINSKDRLYKTAYLLQTCLISTTLNKIRTLLIYFLHFTLFSKTVSSTFFSTLCVCSEYNGLLKFWLWAKTLKPLSNYLFSDSQHQQIKAMQTNVISLHLTKKRLIQSLHNISFSPALSPFSKILVKTITQQILFKEQSNCNKLTVDRSTANQIQYSNLQTN